MINIMLLEGTYTVDTLPDYEQYGAMPSINFPSEVKSVGDSGTINEVASNKNLLNCEEIGDVAAGYGIEIDDEGYVYDSSPNSDSRAWSYSNSNWFLTLPAGTYIISLIYDTTPTNNSTGLDVFNSDDTKLFQADSLSPFLSKTSIDFTLEEKTEIGIMLKFYDVRYKIQLEKASTTTDYVEHKGEEITIPTQQAMLEGDYFEKTDGVWKEIHIWEEYEITGDETITASSEVENGFYFNMSDALNLSASEKASDTSTYVLSNAYRGTAFKDLTNYDYSIALSNASNILIRDKDVTSVEELKTKLSSTSVKIFYKLATANELTCTDEQIVALEKLQNIRTYKNITHVYSTDEVSPNLEVVYAKDNEIAYEIASINEKLDDLITTVDNLSAIVAYISDTEG